MDFYKQIFYKVTNFKEVHHGYIYKDGLNILDKSFELTGSCVVGGLYFTTLEHIHKFYDYGCFLREITLPVENNDFQVVQDNDKYRANMVIFGKRYSLSDPTTFEKLGLIVPSPKILGVFAAQDGCLERLKEAYKNGCPNDILICVHATENNHKELLKWIIDMPYLNSAT